MEDEELRKALGEAHVEQKKAEELLRRMASELGTLADKMKVLATKLWSGHPEE